jgi:hypothetical protein
MTRIREGPISTPAGGGGRKSPAVRSTPNRKGRHERNQTAVAEGWGGVKSLGVRLPHGPVLPPRGDFFSLRDFGGSLVGERDQKSADFRHCSPSALGERHPLFSPTRGAVKSLEPFDTDRSGNAARISAKFRNFFSQHATSGAQEIWPFCSADRVPRWLLRMNGHSSLLRTESNSHSRNRIELHSKHSPPAQSKARLGKPENAEKARPSDGCRIAVNRHVNATSRPWSNPI